MPALICPADREPAVATATLDPDSSTCPRCGRTSVPTDDRGPRPADLHVCPPAAGDGDGPR